MNAPATLDLLRLLVVREVRVRYARTLLGVAWAAFQPAAFLLVFWVLNFERFVQADSRWEAVPYAAFAYCGLVFWIHFHQSLTLSVNSLVISRDMLHKTRFPTELLPLSRVLAALMDVGVGMALLLVAMLATGMTIPVTALLIPLVFLLQLSLTVGLALILSSVNLFFRDVQYLLSVFIWLFMFACNVVWPLDAVSGTAAHLLRLNPLVAILTAYRELLFLGQVPTLESLLPALVGGPLVLAAGLLYFRRVAPRFPEEV